MLLSRNSYRAETPGRSGCASLAATAALVAVDQAQAATLEFPASCGHRWRTAARGLPVVVQAPCMNGILASAASSRQVRSSRSSPPPGVGTAGSHRYVGITVRPALGGTAAVPRRVDRQARWAVENPAVCSVCPELYR